MPLGKERARHGLAGALILALAFLAVPVPHVEAPLSSVLVDGQGNLLGATVARDEQWRFPGTGRVPARYARAVIVYEDKRFLWHPGVDPLAVGRALRLNLTRGEVVSGASTLTMQVVRITRGNPPRTLPEKVLESMLALRLEAACSKDAILAMYADNAPFGGNTVGLEAAAWRYFGRTADELSWAEVATLAVLPNSPSLIHPGRNRDALRHKRDSLLRELSSLGDIDAIGLEAALTERIPEVQAPMPRIAPHLLAHAAGTRIETTLDAGLQGRAVAVVERHQALVSSLGVQNLAAVIVELESGKVLAYIGNVKPGDVPGSHVDVVTASRSTGSVLKPFLYALMLGEGRLLPRQLVPDVPARIGGFSPENFDHAYQGAVPAATALARSRNVPAVWMLRDYGVERFTAALRSMGMTTLFRPADQYGLSLVIGGAEGSLWELVGLYRDLGLTVTHAGGPLPRAMHWRQAADPAERPAVLDAGAASLTLDALVEVNRPGSEAGWRQFRGADAVAWKTGTSQGFRDAWAIGLTRTHVIGVWAGNADGEGRPGLTGYEVAAPLLFGLFDLVPKAGDGFPEPRAQLAKLDVCADSGMLAGPDCVHTTTQKAPLAGERAGRCSHCQPIHCDSGCTHRVTSACASTGTMETRSWFVLPAAQEWYFARRHPEYRTLPPMRDDCRSGLDLNPPLALLSPAPGAAIYVPIETSGERGRVVFEASHRNASAELYWHLDDAFLSTTTAPHQVAIAPASGHHRVTIVDADGFRIERQFTVLDGGGEK